MNDDLNILLHCVQTNIIPKRLKRNVNLNRFFLRRNTSCIRRPASGQLFNIYITTQHSIKLSIRRRRDLLQRHLHKQAGLMFDDITMH